MDALGVTIEDIQRLLQETGQAENGQRLRAIIAERRVRELEAQVQKLTTVQENT